MQGAAGKILRDISKRRLCKHFFKAHSKWRTGVSVLKELSVLTDPYSNVLILIIYCLMGNGIERCSCDSASK